MEESERLLDQRSGEADQVGGAKIFQHMPLQVEDRAVRLVDHDHVERLDRHLRAVVDDALVGHRQR